MRQEFFCNDKMNFFSGSRGSVRYSIYSGDPDGYFSIDPLTGTIRTASVLDHEAHQSVLLNVQAMSGDPPAYGHTQVSGCASLRVSECQQLSGCESPSHCMSTAEWL